VVLIEARTQKQIDGVTTDDKGEFKFNEVALGKYQLLFSFIGYKNKALNNLTLSPEKPDITVNTRLDFGRKLYPLTGWKL